MKYLNKFNENKIYNIDHHYIENCFDNLIDDNIADIRMQLNNAITIHVNYNNDDIEYSTKNNLIEYPNINWSSSLINPTKEIENAIYRLMDEYPDYKINIIALKDKNTTHYRIQINLR